MIHFLKKNYFIYFALLSGFIFFLPDAWDGNIIDYGFETKDFSGIQTFLTEVTRYFDLALFQIIRVSRFSYNHNFNSI